MRRIGAPGQEGGSMHLTLGIFFVETGENPGFHAN